MACACSKGSASSGKWLASFADGTKRVYTTEVEVKAAVKRKGGSYKKV